MTRFEDFTPETRRRNYGWFGDPWPSGVCYEDDADTIVREHMRIPTPVGSPCFWCKELIDEGDQGKATPVTGASGTQVTYTHKECLLREVLGPLKHVRGECTGVGQCYDDTMTARQEAKAVWDWVQAHGV